MQFLTISRLGVVRVGPSKFIAAEGSTPNLDMQVSPELTRPSLSRRSIYWRNRDLCLSRQQMS